MILEYILSGLTYSEKLALARFLKRAVEVITNRYLVNRTYFD